MTIYHNKDCSEFYCPICGNSLHGAELKLSINYELHFVGKCNICNYSFNSEDPEFKLKENNNE